MINLDMPVFQYQILTLKNMLRCKTDICIDDRDGIEQFFEDTSKTFQMRKERKKGILEFEMSERKIKSEKR